MVTHGETMWVWRTILEKLLPQQLRDAMLSQTRQTSIRNCRIIEYTRIDEDGNLADRFARVRFVNPENPDDPETNLDWQLIAHKRWSHRNLLNYASMFKPYISEE